MPTLYMHYIDMRESMRQFVAAGVVVALIAGMAAVPAFASEAGFRAEYVGGTLGVFDTRVRGTMRINSDDSLMFWTARAGLNIPYGQINLIEYGQKVERRIWLAILISPLFILAKSRRHYVTVGFSDAKGQQAAVFLVDKNAIRPVLAGLEAKTGLKVEYQDEAARVAGKG